MAVLFVPLFRAPRGTPHAAPAHGAADVSSP
jgi:hypothetical protein